MTRLDPASSHTIRPFGLYLHFPVCASKCPYCDFVSYPRDRLDGETPETIADALGREMKLATARHGELAGRALDTIYFGGGTPSLLPAEAVGRLIVQARATFSAGDLEITLECNPLSAETARLAAFREAGVSRISLGVQSFHPATLATLGRAHSAEEARLACHRVQELDFGSWGLDLIFGVPHLSGNPSAKPDLERFREDLEEAIALRVPHVSVYGLTIHEGTPFHERDERGELALPDEEDQRRMFLLARSMLRDSGLRHYEISNYARPGHESRHNSLYWSGGEYLGLGAGAHSCFGGRRRANPGELKDYLAAVRAGRYPATAEPAPTPRSLRAERIMLALRQCDGVDPRTLSREIGRDFRKEYGKEIARLVEDGLLAVGPDNVRLTEEGLLLSDRAFEEFF